MYDYHGRKIEAAREKVNGRIGKQNQVANSYPPPKGQFWNEATDMDRCIGLTVTQGNIAQGIFNLKGPIQFSMKYS